MARGPVHRADAGRRCELAPALAAVFVIDPASQSVHDATFDVVEYLPATHAMHVVAPVEAPMSVTDPAAQSEQYVRPVTLVYLPATH